MKLNGLMPKGAKMLIQLSESIQVETPLGRGYALFLESTSQDQYWTVGLDNGAVVTFKQEKIRISKSYTQQRGITDEQMREIIK